MLAKTEIDRLKKALRSEQATLAAGDAATAGDRAAVELDQTRVGRLSRMDAIQQQAMAQAVHARATARLQQIGAALARIETGDYGYCQNCGGRIGADPAVATCIGCAAGKGG
jgi:DnaK suppressor protein